MQSVNAADSVDGSQPAARQTRRPRAARACDLCRAKKNKCNEEVPCSYCHSQSALFAFRRILLCRLTHVGRNVECQYQGQAASDSSVTRQYVQQLEGRLKHLTGRLEEYENASASNPTAGVDTSNLPTASHLVDPSNVAPPTPNSVSPWAVREQEVSGVNTHTRSTEFYGSSSSMTRLSQIHRDADPQPGNAGALLSTLYNPDFRPAESHRFSGGSTEILVRSWYPQCRGFIDTYFTSLHYIHPILDKRPFLDACEALWAGSAAEDQGLSTFEALYFSVLSLGAIVGVRDDEPIDGIDNLEWSRKFFQIAKDRCTRLGMVTDLSITQCYFIMVRIDKYTRHAIQLTYGRQRYARMSFIHIVSVSRLCRTFCGS